MDIKDDYGKVRTFEVPTLEMKIAIDNIDKELKKSYKHDALKNAVPFSVFPNEDYISRFANNTITLMIGNTLHSMSMGLKKKNKIIFESC